MLARKRGRVVNISSIVARTGYRGLAAYGATKAAMEGMTRSLARDVGRRGVTVNAVAPGFLETEMTASLNEVNLDRIQNRSALGRFAHLSEVAAGVSFLLSEAGAGVTGTTITIDAGSTA
jgi:3-oxoacyl-[acyl-carrier protein] reductase